MQHVDSLVFVIYPANLGNHEKIHRKKKVPRYFMWGNEKEKAIIKLFPPPPPSRLKKTCQQLISIIQNRQLTASHPCSLSLRTLSEIRFTAVSMESETEGGISHLSLLRSHISNRSGLRPRLAGSERTIGYSQLKTDSAAIN